MPYATAINCFVCARKSRRNNHLLTTERDRLYCCMTMRVHMSLCRQNKQSSTLAGKFFHMRHIHLIVLFQITICLDLYSTHFLTNALQTSVISKIASTISLGAFQLRTQATLCNTVFTSVKKSISVCLIYTSWKAPLVSKPKSFFEREIRKLPGLK